MQHNTDNVRIISSAPMVSPNTLIDKLPLSEKAASVVVSSRNAIKNILYGNFIFYFQKKNTIILIL